MTANNIMLDHWEGKLTLTKLSFTKPNVDSSGEYYKELEDGCLYQMPLTQHAFVKDAFEPGAFVQGVIVCP